MDDEPTLVLIMGDGKNRRLPWRTARNVLALRWWRLAADIEAAPPDSFKMSVWAEHQPDDGPVAGPWCGTTACAAGTAAFDPYFQARGLTMSWWYENGGGREIWVTDPHQVDDFVCNGEVPSACLTDIFGCENVFYRTQLSRDEMIRLCRRLASDVMTWGYPAAGAEWTRLVD